MSGKLRSTAIVLIATVALTWLSASASADDPILGPNDGVIPIQSMDLRSLGYSATIQLARQQTPGYVAVRIVITGMGAAPADQRLTFRFATHPGGESPPANGLVVDVPVLVPQGARTITVEKYIPKWSMGQNLDVSIWEGGSLLEDSLTQIIDTEKAQTLQFRSNNFGNSVPLNLTMSGFARECRQDWLLIADPDQASPETTSILRSVVLEQATSGSPTNNSASEVDTTDSSRRFHVTGLVALPNDWRGYQSYDVVIFNLVTARRLAAKPTALRPLRNWILQGGTVVNYGTTNMREVLDQLQFGSSQARPDDPTSASLSSRTTNHIESTKKSIRDLLMSSRQGDQGSSETTSLIEVNRNATSGTEILGNVSNPGDQIRVQPVGAGLVFVILSGADHSTDDITAPSAEHLELIKETVNDRSSAMLRDGVEPMLGHRRFRQWTVPNVRRPPVYAFISLLTVFVILVGPVAYRQTSKYGRSHLMFAIAPILAITTTLAMLGYGIISDGFRTRVRIRQLTWVDGKSGDAGERVRATYFAGIRPSGGLRFPGNATVMRQAESDDIPWEEANRLPPQTLGPITISDDMQIFGSPFLPSRDQRQFIFHVPRPGVGSVQLVPPVGGRSEPKLANGLQFPLRVVIVRDGNGDYWGVMNIDAGVTKPCVKLDSRSASSWLGKLHSDYRPMAATGESQSTSQKQREFFDPLGAIARHLRLDQRLQNGIFENWLQSQLQLQSEIPKDHFVATADVSEDVVAVEGSEVVDSVRYVFGTLP